MTKDMNEDSLKKMILADRFGIPKDVAAVVGFHASEQLLILQMKIYP